MEGPFGVQLPENFGSTSEVSTGAPEGSQGTEISPDGHAPEGTQTVSRTAAQPEAPKDSVLDLDKLERFRFEGRDWTRDELRRAYLRQEDYSRKTAELAKERKYSENFGADLRAVVRDPSLFEKFRAVYPESYVKYAQEVLEDLQSQRGQGMPKQTDPNAGQSDPLTSAIEKFRREFKGELSQLSEVKEHFRQAEVEKNRAWLDNQYDTLSKKYQLADPEVVTARAEAALAQGVEITDKVLEKLFKANDAEVKSRFEKVYKEKVTEQVRAGSRAKDTGAGGGTPGQAPRGLKTLKEAEAAMLADIASTRRR